MQAQKEAIRGEQDLLVLLRHLATQRGARPGRLLFLLVLLQRFLPASPDRVTPHGGTPAHRRPTHLASLMANLPRETRREA